VYPGARYFATGSAVSAPMPRVNGEPTSDADLIAWAGNLLGATFPQPVQDPVG